MKKYTFILSPLIFASLLTSVCAKAEPVVQNFSGYVKNFEIDAQGQGVIQLSCSARPLPLHQMAAVVLKIRKTVDTLNESFAQGIKRLECKIDQVSASKDKPQPSCNTPPAPVKPTDPIEPDCTDGFVTRKIFLQGEGSSALTTAAFFAFQNALPVSGTGTVLAQDFEKLDIRANTLKIQ